MGSYTELIIDNYFVLSSKNYVVPEVMLLFCDSDKTIYKRKVSERNRLFWGEIAEEDDYEEEAYEYRITVSMAIDRLEILGFTLSNITGKFNASVKAKLEEFVSYNGSELQERYQREAGILKKYSISDFISAFKELRQKNVRLLMSTNKDSFDLSELALYLAQNNATNEILDFEYPDDDILCIIRVILESCQKDALVIQDITEVTDAGYYSPEEKVRETTLEELSNTYEIYSKIIILTEGSSDRNIIKKSMALLYPHLIDYYSFMDFDGANVKGGASTLISYVKGFMGVGIKNKIIALLDNDTAAYDAKRAIENIEFPPNIKVIHYPVLPLADYYPTIGPTGEQSINVNDLAGSIEMYLGKDVLTEDGKLIPVQWSGYNAALKKYQGELMNKSTIIKNFNTKLENCEQHPDILGDYDWSGLKLILNEIFNAFN